MDKRHYGIDVLKILSMLMIVVLHVLGQGGILKSNPEFSLRYEIAWLLETAAYCSVNCFAMASGYVMVNRQWKGYRLVSLWVQVAFYTLLITALFACFKPETVGALQWQQALLPATHKQYWYFTAYFALFFFIPALNHLLNTLSRRDTFRLLAAAMFLFTFLPSLRGGQDIFVTGKGYSFLWLAVMYLTGGYIKKYDIASRMRGYTAVLLYAACVVISWASKYGIGKLTVALTGQSQYSGTFIAYTSPTITAAGIFLMIACLKIRVKGKAVGNLLSACSASAFSVYLIHVHPLIWVHFMKDRFLSYGQSAPGVMVLGIFAAVLAIYGVCTVIDRIRLELFRLLRVEQGVKWLTEKVCVLCSRFKRTPPKTEEVTEEKEWVGVK